ncbi:NAD-dependent epimerase/dehydratase family protein [bacterium]|nr:NAD-dependent epimerase/dehydratase family protein [bacterium]
MRNVAIISKDHYYAIKLAYDLMDNPEIGKIIVIGKDLSIPNHNKVVYINTLPYFPLSTVFSENRVDTIINFVKIDDETYSSKEAYNLTLQSLKNVLYSGARADVKNYILYSSTVIYGVNKKRDKKFEAKRLSKSGSKFYYSKLRFEAEKKIYEFMDEFPDFNVKIARVAFTLGKNIDNLISSYLGMRFIPIIKGYNPEFEFIHEEDVIRAFEHLIFNGESGIYNVSPDDSISLKEAAMFMDRKLINISKFIAKQVAYFSWILIPGVLKIPPHALEFFMYPFLTDNKSLTNTGFKFKYSLEDTLKEFKKFKQHLK